MKKTFFTALFFSLFLFLFSCQTNTVEPIQNSTDENSLNKSAGNIGINIVLNTSITDDILKQLKVYGNVMDVIPEINGVRILGKVSVLPKIQALNFVETANPDAERDAPPVDAVPVEDFTAGLSPWNLDLINVTDYPSSRVVEETGEGVIIGVLDTGLKDSWRQYFPQERILSDYAKSFSGGGAFGIGAIAEQPNKWEHDQNSHGTHVTSTIIGFSFYGTPIAGVAPLAKIIPVKVLNQNGSGWSSVIAEGIVYMANLKTNSFPNNPVIINMSLGGSRLDGIEKAAIDYAISKGVIIVASAGNRGNSGMGYPGAYQPVISVASCGWIPGRFVSDVPDPTNTADYYIASYSSIAKTGQDLDVTAPGDWVVGPYQLQSGKISYYYLSGTSMASPHVAGIVALLAQKDPSITPENAELKLESSAIFMSGIPSDAQGSGLITADKVLL